MSVDSRPWVLTKGFAVTSISALVSAQAATSLVFIPALLRPLSHSKPFSRSQPATRSSSSLNIPSITDDGRLTPQIPTSKGFDFSSRSFETYEAVAQQFSLLNSINAAISVPVKLFSLGVFSFAAHRARKLSRPLWVHWAASAVLVAVTFPYTGLLMTSLAHKLRRLAGEEEKVEPYEDAPPDRRAEKGNTVKFLTQWGYLNLARSAVLGLASIWSTVAVYHEHGSDFILMV